MSRTNPAPLSHMRISLPASHSKHLLLPRSVSGHLRSLARPDPSNSSSSVVLRPILTTWTNLTTRIHDFSRVCFVDETNPDLLIDFNRLDRVFNDFIRRARIQLNNDRPSTHQTVLPAPVSIEKSADSVMAEWQEFVGTFLHVTECHTEPMYICLSNRLGYLAQMLQGLVNTYDKPHPLIAIRPIRRATAHLEVLKLEALRLGRECDERATGGFNLEEHKESCIVLAEKVHALFPDVFPNNSVTLGSPVSTKREMLIACDNTVAICEGIQGFDELSGAVTDAILAVGQALKKLFGDLRIKRPVGKSGKAETGEKQDKSQDTSSASVERIKRKLMQMQVELADTSNLYKPKLMQTVQATTGAVPSPE